MVNQFAQSLDPHFLQIMVKEDSAMRVAHDDFQFHPVRVGCQIGERGAQSAKAATVPAAHAGDALAAHPFDFDFLPQSGLGEQSGPPHRDVIHLRAGAMLVCDNSHQRQAGGGKEESIGILRQGGRGAFVGFEQLYGFRPQRKDPPHLANLSASIIQKTRRKIEHVMRQVRKIRIIQRAVKPQGNPATLLLVGGVPYRHQLRRQIALALGHAFITNLAYAGLDEIRPHEHWVAMPRPLRPLKPRLDISNLPCRRAAGLAVERLGEAVKIGRREIRNKFAGADQFDEPAANALIVAECEGANGLGASRLESAALPGHEEIKQIKQAARADGSGNCVGLSIVSPAEIDPSAFNVGQGRGIAANETNFALVPAHEPVAMAAELTEEKALGFGDCRWGPVRVIFNGWHCGRTLWKRAISAQYLMKLGKARRLIGGLKILVSPVRFRLCPILPKSRQFNRLQRIISPAKRFRQAGSIWRNLPHSGRKNQLGLVGRIVGAPQPQNFLAKTDELWRGGA